MNKTDSNTQDLKISVSSTSKKPQPTKSLVIILIVCAVALFAASGYYWYKNVLINPNRVLDGALNKSLQSTSVDKTITQENGQSKFEQVAHLSFTPNVLAQSITKLDQSSEMGNTSVLTETIGTNDVDLIRYTGINIEGTNAKQQNFDEILNVWGERKSDPQSGQNVSFLNDALFMAVPFGNLNNDQRKELIGEIKKVGLYKDAKTKTEYKNGRPVVSYTVDIDPQALVEILAKYISVTGIGSSDGLDPAAYKGASKIPIEINIDAISRHINYVDFTGSNRKETYDSYNAVRDIDLPKDTIGVDELQQRLSKIEQDQAN